MGELQSPKNMMVGSYKPNGVEKAAFHRSSGRIRMLLYPHQMSNLVKILLPFSLSTSSEMRGSVMRVNRLATSSGILTLREVLMKRHCVLKARQGVGTRGERELSHNQTSCGFTRLLL